MNDTELESLLRAAPKPSVPPGLHERLAVQARHRFPPEPDAPAPVAEGVWRRWWPTLLVGGGLVACAATLISQHQEEQGLLARRDRARIEMATASVRVSDVPDVSAAAPPGTEDGRRDEILRLRAELAELRSVGDEARRLAAENRRMQDEAAAEAGVSAEELSALDQAQEKARSIRCVNSLKNIGLALRVWAIDNAHLFPNDLLSLTNELTSPRMLVCLSDPGREPVSDWAALGPGGISYEFLAPGASDSQATRVVARCPIHHHILVSDGSVQMSQGDGSNLTRHLVTRDGTLYFE